MANVAEAANALAALLERRTGAYYYDTIPVKIWRLGSGGRSGNCELCEAAADEGWVPDEHIYEGADGDIDGPPAHPHCDCELEFGERRKRIYA